MRSREVAIEIIFSLSCFEIVSTHINSSGSVEVRVVVEEISEFRGALEIGD